jgi:hypothetical protein
VEGLSLKAMMCIVYSSSPDDITSDGLKNVLVINHTKWSQRVVSDMEPGDKVEIVVVMVINPVTKTAVYLIYDEPSDEKMDHCDAPDKNVFFLKKLN